MHIAESTRVLVYWEQRVCNAKPNAYYLILVSSQKMGHVSSGGREAWGTPAAVSCG